MTSMDDGARAWLITVAVDHFWRVAAWYELDDLIQDGFECWARVVDKYEHKTGRVRNRAHLMRLFKWTYLNHIHTLSKRNTTRVLAEKPKRRGYDRKPTYVYKRVERCLSDIVADADHDSWDNVAEPADLYDYEKMIAEAPQSLQPLLKVLLSNGPSPLLRACYRRASNGERETLNSRLCRLMGIDPERRDLVTELRTFLTA